MTRLRPATQTDVPAMVALQRGVFAEALLPHLPAGYEVGEVEPWERMLGEVLETEGAEGLVAEGDDGLEGLVMFGLNRDAEPAPGTGEIRALFVRSASWRTGVGRSLVDGATTRLREMGYERVTLWSLRDNDRATAFYERLGFRRDGATQVRESLGAPEVRYAREL